MSRQERRQQLIEVAVELFSQKGFEGTTTREIGQAAGVTEAVIFQHFATKSDLYRAVLEHKLDVWGEHERREQIAQMIERRDDEALFRLIIGNTLRVMRDDAAFIRVLLLATLQGHKEVAQAFHEIHKGPNQNRLREYILLRQQEGVFRKQEVNVTLMALDGLTIHFGMVRYLIGAPGVCGDASDDEVVERFVNILLDGLRVPVAPASPGQKPAAKRPANSSRRTAARPPRKKP